ncbi:MAG: Lrp/AsnC ligand binding domain-containing protein [Caldivirga sp.]
MAFEVFLLVQTRVGKVFEVSEKIKAINWVKVAYSVTGPYDVIALAEVNRVDDLENLIKMIHSIDGVERTLTAMVIRKHS